MNFMLFQTTLFVLFFFLITYFVLKNVNYFFKFPRIFYYNLMKSFSPNTHSNLTELFFQKPYKINSAAKHNTSLNYSSVYKRLIGTVEKCLIQYVLFRLIISSQMKHAIRNKFQKRNSKFQDLHSRETIINVKYLQQKEEKKIR